MLRLYDDGMAYRFVTQKKGTIVVEREQADFTFPEDYTTRAPYVHRLELKDFEWQFSNSFENTYVRGADDAARSAAADVPARAGRACPKGAECSSRNPTSTTTPASS